MNQESKKQTFYLSNFVTRSSRKPQFLGETEMQSSPPCPHSKSGSLQSILFFLKGLSSDSNVSYETLKGENWSHPGFSARVSREDPGRRNLNGTNFRESDSTMSLHQSLSNYYLTLQWGLSKIQILTYQNLNLVQKPLIFFLSFLGSFKSILLIVTTSPSHKKIL